MLLIIKSGKSLFSVGGKKNLRKREKIHKICHWFSYDLLFSNNNSDWHKVIALIYISPSHVLYIIFYFFFLSGKWSYRNGTNKRRNRIATLGERFSKCSQYAHATWKRGNSWKMKIVVILKTIPKEIIITYEVIKII